MNEQLKKVAAFQRAFSRPVGAQPTAKIDPDVIKLRAQLLQEEVAEYIMAAKEGNDAEVLDALGDILYILLGTAIVHGMHGMLSEAFDEIHESNMSKLDANGNPIFREDGKILKGENYFKPDLEQFFKVAQYEAKNDSITNENDT